MHETNQQQELKRTMKSRHLFMIALGGVIGTGFFLSTGYTVGQAGPFGAVLSYLIGGLSMYLIMLCLGELAVAYPVAGSFQDYTTRFINPATGFTIGWLYWLGWAVTVALELISIGMLMDRWFPDVSLWVWCLVFGIILFVVNAFSAKGFAETEFWFSSIKVLTIIVFIILGGAAMFGFITLKGGEAAPMLNNFTKDGLFPNGFGAVLMTMLAVNFSFQGTELIGIASGESENPDKTIPRAINQTVWRTILFFGLAIFVLAGLIPWKEAGVMESPFVVAFEKLGIPYAADVMNFVILMALLSVANSGLYATTRMLYSLSHNGMASPIFGKVTKKGVPLNALILSMGFACLSLLSYRFAEDTIYMSLLSIAGVTAVLAWMSIAASQFFFRIKYVKEGGKVEDLKFKTPLFPIVPILAFVINLVVLVSQWFDPATRSAITFGVPAIIICYIVYFLFFRKKFAALQAQRVTE
ncbi:amino acid permease [Laceyella sacchari]|uniref:Amino acid permease n=1 Tax=Laceyella sacchari TaxID=37482 RepID=A0ABY5U4C0_LACSH|nr:amino acid permease [Laceyella sacchari]TCW38779.1 arginine:proton symporter (AAT family) [Laceyella sacchari]UWE03122.1 amino acid permease [Laceyella sacchari]